MKIETVPLDAPNVRRAQTRAGSFTEASVNVAIGYVVALAAQAVILPAFGVEIPLGSHMGIAACFTAVSIARSYVVRRIFEHTLVRCRAPEGESDPRAL